MRFTHAGVSYRVVCTSDPIYDDSGRAAWGIADPNTRDIRLDASMTDEYAEYVLLHELAHTWKFITDFDSTDEETLAVHMGSFAKWLFVEYLKQGGRARLGELLAHARQQTKTFSVPRFVNPIPRSKQMLNPHNISEEMTLAISKLVSDKQFKIASATVDEGRHEVEFSVSGKAIIKKGKPVRVAPVSDVLSMTVLASAIESLPPEHQAKFMSTLVDAAKEAHLSNGSISDAVQAREENLRAVAATTRKLLEKKLPKKMREGSVAVTFEGLSVSQS